MSLKQFEEFYWPTFRCVIEGIIKIGLIPMPHFQGKWEDRCPFLQELAKNHKEKMIYRLGQSDIIKANDTFGGYACLRGNVPSSLLSVGTTLQVEEYLRKCIETCIEGGDI